MVAVVGPKSSSQSRGRRRRRRVFFLQRKAKVKRERSSFGDGNSSFMKERGIGEGESM